MSTSENSYGTAADVASLVPRYLSNGAFTSVPTATLRPSLSQVEGWIDQVSANLNVAFSQVGFMVPIIQEDAKNACIGAVINAVSDMCHYVNSAGRFYSEKALEAGVSPWISIYAELNAWVTSMTKGFIKLGVPWEPPVQLAHPTSTINNPYTFNGTRDIPGVYRGW